MFQEETSGDHAGRILITNMSQYPLTAIAIEISPDPASNIPLQTQCYDAFTHSLLAAPVPRGLTFVTSTGHFMGKPFPNATIAAAIWEDGSTFGSSDALNLILEVRRTTLAAFDRTLSVLQTGLEAEWTISQYLAALESVKSPNLRTPGMREFQSHVAEDAILGGAESTIVSQSDKGKLSHVIKALQASLKRQRDQLAGSAPTLSTTALDAQPHTSQ